MKPPPGTKSPEEGGEEKGAGRNPEVHQGTGMSIPKWPDWKIGPAVWSCLRVESLQRRGRYSEGTPVVRESERFHFGYGSSDEMLSEVGRRPSRHGQGCAYGGEPVQGQEGTSIGGQSPDDESGTVLEEAEGNDKGCRKLLRGDQAMFPRGMMSGREMELVWGN